MNDNIKNILKLFLLILLVTINIEANEKAEVKAYDFTSQNVLHDAVRAYDFEMVQYLIKQDVDINKQDEYGYTPLHLAVRLHQFDISSFLIENKAIVNTKDTYLDTPLIDATRNNDTNISKLLICHGAQRNVSDTYGMTTLQNSAKNKNQEIVNLLRVDDLRPYCQKELKISMHPFKVTTDNYYEKEICGDIIKGVAVDISLEFTDADDEIFGPFAAKFDNDKKTWCLDTSKTTLLDDVYRVTATAKDYVVNTHSDTNIDYTYSQKLNIYFDDINTTTYPYPRICGHTNSDAIDLVDITLIDEKNKEYGVYSASIDDKNKKWCADVTDKLNHGTYTIEAHAFDLYDQYTLAKKENYLVDTAVFNISIEEIKEKNNLPDQVCGTTNKSNLKSLDIHFIDEFQVSYQMPTAIIDNEKKTWCSEIREIPPKGFYTVKAYGTTNKNENASDLYDSYNLGNIINNDNPKITLNDINETVGYTPKICGKILQGEIVKGMLTIKDKSGIQQGNYKLKIDTQEQKFCAQITDKLENGIYSVEALAINSKRVEANATSSFEVFVIPNLYNELMIEFKDDMKSWNAHLDKNSLIFSFRDPQALFKIGKSKLNNRFKEILDDFFPRYVKVTSRYKEYIQNIIIEGHSSSENNLGKTKAQRYDLNKILSVKRANNVLSYTNKIVSEHIGKNIIWVIKAFESDGLSSSHLIYHENGTENKEMSRRVEFRIKNIRSELVNKRK